MITKHLWLAALVALFSTSLTVSGFPYNMNDLFSDQTIEAATKAGGKALKAPNGNYVFEFPAKTAFIKLSPAPRPVVPYAIFSYKIQGEGNGKMGFLARFSNAAGQNIGNRFISVAAKDGKFAAEGFFRASRFKGQVPTAVHFDLYVDKGSKVTISQFNFDDTKATRADNTLKPVKRSDWADAYTDELTAKAAKLKDVPVMFLGDSITQLWSFAADHQYPGGLNSWNQHFEPMKAANFGISGDQVENVLWRVTEGRQLICNPKKIVLLIGTNNLHQPQPQNTPEEIAEGVINLVNVIQKQLPEAKILLLGVFPRTQRGNHQDFDHNAINAILAAHKWNNKVTFKDYSTLLLGPTGKITKEIFRDGIHLSPKGYEVYAQQLLKDIPNL